MSNILLDAALEYASRGWRVFPCIPGKKIPLTEHGFLDATTEADVIKEWWARWPTANVAIACGIAARQGPVPHTESDSFGDGTPTGGDGLLVIDVDPRNGGSVPQGLPLTLSTLTGGGGYHFYYTYNQESLHSGAGVYRGFRKLLTTGVDIKSEGGYVLAPPSTTDSDYRWEGSYDSVTEAPPWLLEACLKPTNSRKVHEQYLGITSAFEGSESPYSASGSLLGYDLKGILAGGHEERPGDIFNRTATWEEILEPHGWTLVGESEDENEEGITYVEQFWCRPGKTEGISATTNYGDSGLLYVFTTSTQFEGGEAHTKFNAHTLLNHGGDYSQSAAELAREYDICMAAPSLINQKEYSFEPAVNNDHFISRFIEYVSAQTDAPREYAEASALVLLSVASYRCRSALAPYPGGLASNLYISLVGTTTRSRKSTVQRITADIMRSVMAPAVLPNRATTEALIKSLANRNGIASVWMPDEFGVTLAEIYNRDFMRGLEEMLLTVYGGDDYEYQRVLDSIVIRRPHLSVLAAATPESISRAGVSALDSGLLPRFAVVFPDALPPARAVAEAPDLSAERRWLINYLNQILTWSNSNESITFSEEALKALNNAEQVIASGNGARLPTMLYKVAALIAIGEGLSTVSTPHARSATTIVTRWKHGMEALVPIMFRHGTDQAFEQQLEYVYNIAKEHGRTPRTDIANLVNVTKRRLDEIEQTLVDKGRIRVEMVNGNNKVWSTQQ